MMDSNPQCCIHSFVEIGRLVPGKKIFKGVFTIYVHGSHLGYVTNIMLIDFHFLVQKSYYTKFAG